jgi:DNA-binding HxlR family transcriptional regulator
MELAVRSSAPDLERMNRYGQFCPVALGSEIFAERWTPLILRELLLSERSFSDLHRGVPRMSRNLLTRRLGSLRSSGIIERVDVNGEHKHRYRLTEAGRALGPVIDALGVWGYNWASKDLEDEHLDPDFLMWSVRRMIRVDALPQERVVIAFRFRRHTDRLYWLVLQRPEVDLCLNDPGYEVNLEVEGTVAALARVCLGHLSLIHAMRDGEVEVHGAPSHRNALPSWLGVSRFAALTKPVNAAPR